MMEKRFEIQGKTASGQPLIHLVEPGSSYGLHSSAGLEKTASSEHLPEVIELVESIAPQEGRLYLVNSALGAGEYVGFNLRGDWFTEKGLRHTPDGWDDIPVWDIDARRRLAAQTSYVPRWGNITWGYPTFYNAHKFRHHRNKDPNRAYGYILGAFWDHRMHRVILVSELIRENCERLGALDLYCRIEGGEFPDTSMGARVPYDICSICGHVARTPAHYCEHVGKHAVPPYGMRSILPDGRRCGVYNTYPNFFDDSYVFIGAEKSAKNMANVTRRVAGSRPYTQKIYTMPRRSRVALASADNGVSDALEKTPDQELGEAATRAMRPPSTLKGVEGIRVREKMSQILSLVPATTAQEKKALEFVVTDKYKKAAIKDSTLTRHELELWRAEEMQRLMRGGVDPILVDRAKALVNHHLTSSFGDKTASVAKWAEHLKSIPAPGDRKYALLKDHEGRLQQILPRRVLDTVADDLPGGLSGLAQLGVVLRPVEFAFCVRMNTCGPSAANVILKRRVAFAPTPLDLRHTPNWRPRPTGAGLLDALRDQLGPALRMRSFHPSMIVRRINEPPALQSVEKPLVDDGPEMTKISQLYNDYREGLIEYWDSLPDRLPTDPFAHEKFAHSAEVLSSMLLSLAYWPAIDLG